jgi:hypothetical protein
VDVVAEKRVGVHVDPGHQAGLAQVAAPGVPVLVVDEDRLTVVADLHQVMRQAGQGEAGQAGHRISLADPY